MSKYVICATTVLCALIAAVSSNAFSQTSDCVRAQSTAEQSQCANQQFSAAEKEMQQAFSRAVENYTPSAESQNSEPALPKSEEMQQRKWERQMRSRLQHSQKVWLAYRESACEVVRKMYEGGNFASVAIPLCKVEITQARTKFLLVYFDDQK